MKSNLSMNYFMNFVHASFLVHLLLIGLNFKLSPIKYKDIVWYFQIRWTRKIKDNACKHYNDYSHENFTINNKYVWYMCSHWIAPISKTYLFEHKNTCLGKLVQN